MILTGKTETWRQTFPEPHGQPQITHGIERSRAYGVKGYNYTHVPHRSLARSGYSLMFTEPQTDRTVNSTTVLVSTEGSYQPPSIIAKYFVVCQIFVHIAI